MNTKAANNPIGKSINAYVPGMMLISKIKSLGSKIIAAIKLLERIRQERQELSRMSPKLLADIGVDAEAARQEYVRRYFDLPGGRW